jgi:hypothetical protein
MRIVIVGQKNGKAVIRWPQYLGLSFALSMLMGIGSGTVFFILAGRWSHATVFYGIAMGIGIAGVGVINGLRTSPDKLTAVN